MERRREAFAFRLLLLALRFELDMMETGLLLLLFVDADPFVDVELIFSLILWKLVVIDGIIVVPPTVNEGVLLFKGSNSAAKAPFGMEFERICNRPESSDSSLAGSM